MSGPAADLSIASLSESTIKQYNTSYKLWWQYCLQNNQDVYKRSVTVVLDFLANQFNEGSSYGSLNCHRSALSILLGDELGSDERIKRLLKGVFKQRPNFPKYSGTWDPQIVLDYIEHWYPNNNLSLERITKKVVILLALCTGHRVQTFSKIRIEDIHRCNNRTKIVIKDIIKTSAVGREQPVLFLPFFVNKPCICPAKALQDYLDYTKGKRTSTSHLFLTVKPPHRDATAQSISRWIKQVLAECGVDVGRFSAHSTRHAATSAAHAAGVSIDTIRKTAGWTSSSETFARFYNRPIIDETIFARSVCLQ